MIDALIGGKLYGKPVQRTGSSGKPFVTCKVRTPVGDGLESIFVNVIAFSQDVTAALLALDDGDSVSLSGSLTPKTWTDKNGAARPALDLVAHAAVTAYHVTRKRAAMKPAQSASKSHDGLDDAFRGIDGRTTA